MALTTVNRGTIEAVYDVIKPHIRVTPVMELDGRDLGLDALRLVLKLEQLQHSGSFKARGAFANVLMRAVPDAGVVAASGGNHGAAVAYAAMRLGVRAKIFVPTASSPVKIQRIRDYGADLVVTGDRYADALAASEAWAARSGALAVHAFDQLETLLGQATIGLELAVQAPALDAVLIPVGGGGLIGGVAAWYAGTVRVVGVEPEGAPTLTAALGAGQPVDAPANSIAADSLAPRRVGELVFPIVRATFTRSPWSAMRRSATPRRLCGPLSGSSPNLAARPPWLPSSPGAMRLPQASGSASWSAAATRRLSISLAKVRARPDLVCDSIAMLIRADGSPPAPQRRSPSGRFRRRADRSALSPAAREGRRR